MAISLEIIFIPKGNKGLKRCITALCLLVAISATITAESEEFRGKVVGIVDGDTLDVMRDGKAARVRLWGIDTPEKRQAFGARAKQFTADHCFQKEVTVRIKDQDRYKRLVGEVILAEGVNLNQELVRAGMAWWYKRYAPGDGTLEHLQETAQQSRTGLWEDAFPIPPWKFRRGAKRSEPGKTESSDLEEAPKTIGKNLASRTVYITKSGKCYHRYDCATLKDGKYAVTLKEAAERGFTPCKRCKP